MVLLDYLGEAVAFGVDSLLLVVCFRLYLRCKHVVESIQAAPVIDINNKLDESIRLQPGQIFPYCVVRGTVSSLASPIYSLNARDITGVIQRLSTKQHIIARNPAGFWSEQDQTIQEVYNVVPFMIRAGRTKVEVVDSLKAEILDLETIADQFEPAISTIGEQFWGFVSGVRQRGLQSTEEMLREGALITGFGELALESDGKSLRLQPPSDGSPYFLTSLPLTSLLRKIDEEKTTLRSLTVIFGSFAVIIGCVAAHHYWRVKARNDSSTEDAASRAERERARRARRRDLRDRDVPDEQKCVVCRENPREVILLPCGHVCLCEDCSEDIVGKCPVCRGVIRERFTAYLT